MFLAARFQRAGERIKPANRHVENVPPQAYQTAFKAVDGIHKELSIIASAYNLVRVVMIEAARRQGVQSDRISFIDGLRWLRNARLGEDLRPLRVDRVRRRTEPRVRRRRPKGYPLMKRPRAVLRKALAG